MVNVMIDTVKRRILIYADIESPGIKIYKDNSEFIRDVNSKLGGNCPNVGNKVWFYGLVSELTQDGNSVSFYDGEMTYDYINEHFDSVVISEANLFSFEFENNIDSVISFISKIKVPIHIISVGLQADDNNEIKTIEKELGKKIITLLDYVYNTGGSVCVRGNITAELCSNLGFSQVFVGGAHPCTSLEGHYVLTKKIVMKRCA